MSQLFTQFGTNYTLPLLDVLSDYYDSTDAQRTWYMSSFSLTSGTMILMSGRIGDIFGLRLTVMLGFAWTTIWGILSGAAFYVKDPTFFIVSRAFQGIGLAFVLPNVLGAAGRVYPAGSKRKFMAFGLIGVAAPIGGCCGPILSGLIGEFTPNWNWICWAYSIATALAAALTWYSMPHFEHQKAAVDWIGCGLAVVGLVLLCFVFNQAPVAGWDNPYIIVLLIVSVVELAFFIWYEVHYPSNPLLPGAVVKNSRVLLAILGTFLGWGSFGIAFYRFFVFVLQLRHYNPLQTGACTVPAIISGGVAALTCGYVLRWIPVHLIQVISMVFFFAGDVLLLTLKVDQTYFRQSLGFWVEIVWGCDLNWTASAVLLSDLLPHDLQGMAGSLTSALVNYSQASLMGLAGTVEERTFAHHPGDILKVHKNCMWFAFGLSAASIVVSIIMCIMHYSVDKRKSHRKAASVKESSEIKEPETGDNIPDDRSAPSFHSAAARLPGDEDPRPYENAVAGDEMSETASQVSQSWSRRSIHRASELYHEYREHYPHEIPDQFLAPHGSGALI